MATPLRVPIRITIYHVENAVRLCMPSSGLKSTHPNADTICDAAADREAYDQVEPALKLQNIDWNTWLPEVPLKVAGHEAVFNPDGSVKVGCQVIASKDVDEILKRREKAMVKPDAATCAESEWPKYWVTETGNVYCAHSANDGGLVRSKAASKWSLTDSRPMEEYATKKGMTKLTRAEAAKILGISEADL